MKIEINDTVKINHKNYTDVWVVLSVNTRRKTVKVRQSTDNIPLRVVDVPFSLLKV
jgi:hypothetical protein